MKSPLSRAMSTRAYLAAPGVFLYADSRASSRAAISRSDEIPFSRSRTRTASTISLLMRSALQQVASVDVRVRDRDHPVVGRHRHLTVARADELPGEGHTPVVLLACAYASLPAYEAAEVMRLGQGTLRPRRGDLQRVVDEQVAQVIRHALAKCQIHAVGVVDEKPHFAAWNLLDEQHLDVRVGAGEPALDVFLGWLRHTVSGRKKGGPAKPTPGAAHGRR